MKKKKILFYLKIMEAPLCIYISQAGDPIFVQVFKRVSDLKPEATL